MTEPVDAAAVEEAAALLGARARRGVPLGPLTTYRVGGPAALLVEANDADDLEAVAQAVSATRLRVLVVGNGSNLLVADRGFPGVAVTLGSGFETIDRRGDHVVAGGAVSLPVLARRTASMSLRGLEWAVGVPGTVGGGVRMNAGGHGSDISRTLVRARVVNLSGCAGGTTGESKASDLSPAELALGYRISSLRDTDVVVEAEFALREGDGDEAAAVIADIVRWRRENQPGGANAGSVFSNPPDHAAGRLIEEAGLKGHRRGSAFVSPRHANFFQVDPGGSADDVWQLMSDVRRIVRERTGVDLLLEIRTVGFPVDSTSTGG